MSFVCDQFLKLCPFLISFSAIVEDARYPQKYRMLVSTVDVIFADVAQPDQARIVHLNSEYFLKNGGHVVISIKASCVDSTIPPETVFVNEVDFLRKHDFKPLEQVTLEPYERDHAMVSGTLFPLFLGEARPFTHDFSCLPTAQVKYLKLSRVCTFSGNEGFLIVYRVYLPFAVLP